MHSSPIARVMREEARTWSKIGLAILAFTVLAPVYRAVTESRDWRDVTGQTPFHSVVVTSADVVPDGLRVAGEMIKRRCYFDGLSGYVLRGPSMLRVPVNTAPEDAVRPNGSRPPSPLAQLWGPWVIEVAGETPDAWMIFAHHICPGEETAEQNLFAQGNWPK